MNIFPTVNVKEIVDAIYPIGTVITNTGNDATLPYGFVRMNGGLISKSQYPLAEPILGDHRYYGIPVVRNSVSVVGNGTLNSFNTVGAVNFNCYANGKLYIPAQGNIAVNGNRSFQILVMDNTLSSIELIDIPHSFSSMTTSSQLQTHAFEWFGEGRFFMIQYNNTTRKAYFTYTSDNFATTTVTEYDVSWITNNVRSPVYAIAYDNNVYTNGKGRAFFMTGVSSQGDSYIACYDIATSTYVVSGAGIPQSTATLRGFTMAMTDPTGVSKVIYYTTSVNENNVISYSNGSFETSPSQRCSYTDPGYYWYGNRCYCYYKGSGNVYTSLVTFRGGMYGFTFSATFTYLTWRQSLFLQGYNLQQDMPQGKVTAHITKTIRNMSEFSSKTEPIPGTDLIDPYILPTETGGIYDYLKRDNEVVRCHLTDNNSTTFPALYARVSNKLIVRQTFVEVDAKTRYSYFDASDSVPFESSLSQVFSTKYNLTMAPLIMVFDTENRVLRVIEAFQMFGTTIRVYTGTYTTLNSDPELLQLPYRPHLAIKLK